MNISCPQCATAFQVANDALSDGPRNMRCSHCDHIWLAETDSDKPGPPVTPDAEVGAGPAAGPQPESPEAQAARLLAASRRLNQIYALKKNNRRDAIRKAGAIAAGLSFFAAGLYAFSNDVVRQFPATAVLYEALGQPVNIRGMEFRNVVYERDYDNGLPVLSVRGEIVNIARRPLPVPKVRFGLRDAARQEIYHWTMTVSDEPLAPKRAAKFITRLASPPSEAKDLQIRFADKAGTRKRY